MQHTTTHDMDLFLPLISLLLIAGGDSQHAIFTDAAMTTSPNSPSLTPRKYWEAVLPKTPMPPAISDLIAQENDDIIIASNDLKFVKGLRKIGPNYERVKPEADHGDKHVHIASKVEDGLKELFESEHEEDPRRITMSYGSELEEFLDKLTMSYGKNREEDPKRITMSYGSEHEDDPAKITISYGSEHEDDSGKITMSYGPQHEDYPKKITMSSYGSKHEDDPAKIRVSFGSEDEDDPDKLTMSYGSENEEDPHKLTISYGSEHVKDLKHVCTGYGTHIEATPTEKGSYHVHAQHQKKKRKQLADVFFFHDMLRLGSVITPTIPPTTSLPALLPRHVASSIPFSTEHLSEIMARFAPVSPAMAREIRWTLDACEHPRTLPGEAARCATSLESLVELPASLLRTRKVRAFSAADLPVEAVGTPALRGRYNVTAVRNLSGQSSEMVTCHDLKYPYAVYYCHTASPAAAYAVTLASVEDRAAPATIGALAVCHLDTSRWSPKHPFLEVHNVRPGDVAVCHFLTKLSMVWVRADEQGDE